MKRFFGRSCFCLIEAARIKVLGEQLRKGNVMQREAAVSELGGIEDASVVPLLGAALDDRDSVQAVESAKAALVRLGRKPEFRVLVRQTLVSKLVSKRFLARTWAAEALGKVGGVEAMPHLTRMLEKEAHPFARLTVVCAFQEIGHRSAVEPIVSLLEKEQDSNVANAASSALAKLSAEFTRRKEPSLPSNQAEEALLLAASHFPPSVKGFDPAIFSNLVVGAKHNLISAGNIGDEIARLRSQSARKR